MVDKVSQDSALPPTARVVQMLHGKIVAQAICAAAELKLADHLGETPESCDTLAERTGTDPRSLYRLLRLLASVHVFVEHPDKRFGHTAESMVLQSDTVGSVQAIARMIGSPWHAEAETKMLHSVRRGAPAFRTLHGMDIFEYLGQHEEAAQIFNQAMTGLSEAINHAIVAAYDFASARRVVDVGGGSGSLLCSILRAHTHLRGTLFDMSSAIRSAVSVAASAGVTDRCELAEGSFFESVPQDGDVYLLKFILHDWDDRDAVKILKACRQSASRASKLLIIEDLIGPPNVLSNAKLTDLEMLTIFGGRERTEGEYAHLLEQSGFTLNRVLPAAAPVFLLEASPS
jgi:hypothetical protein